MIELLKDGGAAWCFVFVFEKEAIQEQALQAAQQMTLLAPIDFTDDTESFSLRAAAAVEKHSEALTKTVRLPPEEGLAVSLVAKKTCCAMPVSSARHCVAHVRRANAGARGRPRTPQAHMYRPPCISSSTATGAESRYLILALRVNHEATASAVFGILANKGADTRQPTTR